MPARISRSELFSLCPLACMLASIVLAWISRRGAHPDQVASFELINLTYADARPGGDGQFLLMLGLGWCKHAGVKVMRKPCCAKRTGDFLGMGSKVRKTVPIWQGQPCRLAEGTHQSCRLRPDAACSCSCRPCRHAEERAAWQC